jgi:dedicator of cytokinesis protein 3
MRAFVATPCAKGEFAELYFSLFNKSENRFLTEEFCAILNHNGVLARDPAATKPVSTLFTELAPQEVQDSIFLVCRIVRKGAMRMSADPSGLFNPRGPSRSRFRGDATSTGYSIETGITTSGTITLPLSALDLDESQQVPVQPSNAPGFRRPFGCAVLELSQLSKMTADSSNVSSTKEYSMPIFVPIHEAAFSTLHQDLVENRTKEFEKSTR